MAKDERAEIKRLKLRIAQLEKKLLGQENKKERNPKKKGRKSFNLLKSVLESFPDMILILKPDGTILTCNRSVRSLLKKGVASKSVFEIFPHPIEEKWRDNFGKLIKSTKPIHFEREREGKFYSHYIFPVLSPKQGHLFTVVRIQDITDYHLTLNALSSSEDKYKSLVENISDVIYALNEEGVIIYVNPAFKNFLGFEKEEAKGELFGKFIHPDYCKLWQNDLQTLLSGKSLEKEYRFLHKNNSWRWGRISVQPLFFKNAIIGYQGVITDITRSRSFNLDRLQAFQERVLWRLTSSFASAVENPIKQARMILLELTRKNIDFPDQENLRKTMHALEVISVYLKNFMLIADKNRHELAEISINSILENTYGIIKEELEKERVQVQWFLARDLAFVELEPLNLIQAFFNIFSYSLVNFTKHKSEPRLIYIKTAQEKDKIAIYYLDNSCGLEPEIINRLADPFLGSETPSEAGLELIMAMHLIENCSGSLSVLPEAELGGMSLKITLPAIIPFLETI